VSAVLVLEIDGLRTRQGGLLLMRRLAICVSEGQKSDKQNPLTLVWTAIVNVAMAVRIEKDERVGFHATSDSIPWLNARIIHPLPSSHARASPVSRDRCNIMQNGRRIRPR
jgi:hypothetical protein